MTKAHQEHIHILLGHSYLFYFTGLMAGALFNIFHDYPLWFRGIDTTGILLLMIGSVLMVLAQTTTRQTRLLRKDHEEVVHSHFYSGPYKYTRSPTHLGLGLVMLGLAFLFGSLMMTIIAVLSFFITRYIFIRKEEHLLEEKYGNAYRIYKKRVQW